MHIGLGLEIHLCIQRLRWKRLVPLGLVLLFSVFDLILWHCFWFLIAIHVAYPGWFFGFDGVVSGGIALDGFGAGRVWFGHEWNMDRMETESRSCVKNCPYGLIDLYTR